jgi:hypothetical protein
MSTDWNDPEVEALLAEIAGTDEERARIAEEHRQMEKDLYRLADPLPPHDFVQSVMQRVEAAPARPISRGDVVIGITIVFGAIAAGVTTLVAGTDAAGVGLAIANLTIEVRSGLVAMGSGLLAVWATAALPMAIGLCLSVWLSLASLRRFPQPAGAKVLP